MARYLAFTAAVLVLLAGVAWFLLPTEYEAYALVRVAYQPAGVLPAPAESLAAFDVFKNTQLQLIRSGPVLLGAIDDPKISKLPLIEQADDPVAWLNHHLELSYPDNAEILRVAVRGEDPEQLVEITNALVESYLNLIVEGDRDRRAQAEARLEKQYSDYSAELVKQTEALHTLEQLNKVGGTEGARVRKRIQEEALFEAISLRNNLMREIQQTDLQMHLKRAQGESPTEERTADPGAEQPADSQRPAAAESPARHTTPDADLPLLVLEKKMDYLQQKLQAAQDAIEKEARAFDDLEQVSGSVATKQEDLAALKRVRNELRAELDRIQVERLRRERITKLDDARIESPDGNLTRKYVGLVGAIAASVLLLGLAVSAGGGRRHTARD